MEPSSSTTDKGAAEEPEPEPEPGPLSSSAATAASYDPREYQPAHPDDRDGNPIKPGKAKGKGKAKGGADGKGKDDGAHRCGNCDAPDAKRTCKGCGVERYCGKECQAVRAVWWWSGVNMGEGGRLALPSPFPHLAPRRSTGSTAATGAPAPPTSSRPPPTRSRSASARRRSRPTSALSVSSPRASPPRSRAATRSARRA